LSEPWSFQPKVFSEPF